MQSKSTLGVFVVFFLFSRFLRLYLLVKDLSDILENVFVTIFP